MKNFFTKGIDDKPTGQVYPFRPINVKGNSSPII